VSLQAVFDQYNLDPEFAKLSYGAQTIIRSEVAAKELMLDPEFQTLSEGAKKIVLQSAVIRPPALENKAQQQQFESLVKKADGGDKAAQGEIGNILARRAVYRSGIIGNLSIRASSALAGKLSQLGMGELSPAAGAEYMTGTDSDKIVEYLGYRAQEKGSVYKQFQVLSTVAGVEGAVVDAIPLFMALPNSAGAVVKTAIEKSATGARLARTAFGSLAARSLLPQAAETFVGGLMGIAQQNAVAALSAQPELYTDTLQKMGRSFTQGAALDFVGGMVMREHILGKTYSMLKGVFGGVGDTKKLAGKAIDAAIEELPTSAGAAREIRDLQGTLARSQQWFTDRALSSGRSGLESVNLRQVDRTVLAAQSMGEAWFAPSERGTFHVFLGEVDQTGKLTGSGRLQHGEFKTIGEVQDVLARRSWQIVNTDAYWPTEASKSAFMADHRWMVNRGITLAELDGALSGRSAKDAAAGIGSRRGRFATVASRSYASLDEVDTLARGIGPQGTVVRVDIGTETGEKLTRLREGKSPVLGSELERSFRENPGGDGVLVINSLADQKSMEIIDGVVRRAKAAGAEESVEALRAGYALEQGFDGTRLADGSYVSFNPRASVKALVAEVDPVTGALRKKFVQAPAGVSERGSVSLTSGEIVRAGSLRGNANKYAAAFQGTFTGRVLTPRAETLMQMAAGLSDADLKSGIRFKARDVAGGDVSFKILTDAKGNTILSYPNTISTPERQRAFIQSFTSQIDKISPALKHPSVQEVTSALKKSMTLRPFTNATGAVKKRWLAGVVEDLGGKLTGTAEGGYRIELPGRAPFQSQTLTEVEGEVALSMLDEGTLTKELTRAGWNVRRMESGFELRRGSDVIRTPDAAGAARAAGLADSLVSNRLAPTTVLLSKDALGVEYVGSALGGKALRGTAADLLRALDGFVDVPEAAGMKEIRELAEGVRINRYVRSGGIRVEMPSLAAAVDFEDLAGARKFIEEIKGNDVHTLRKVAARKGVDLRYDGRTGQYLVTSAGGVTGFKSVDELKSALSQIPDGVGLREILSGIDPKFDREIASLQDEFYQNNPDLARAWMSSSFGDSIADWKYDFEPELVDPPAAGTLGRVLKHEFGTFNSWVDSTTKNLGLPELKNRIVALKNATTLMDVRVSEAHKLSEAIFSDGGKMLTRERRVALQSFLEAGPEGGVKWLDAEKAFGPLSPRERLVVDRVRRVYGERIGTNVNGLAATFSIPFWKFIDSYFPHMRSVLDSAAGRAGYKAATTADDLLRVIWKDGVPDDIHVFFENLRKDEIAQFVMDKDSLSVLMRYQTLGFRKMYLQEPWQQMSSYVRTNGSSLPKDVQMSVERFRMMALGIYKTDSIKLAEQAGIGLAEKLGFRGKSAEVGKDLLKAYFSLSYAGTLGFRPVRAITNALQVFSTFTARFDDAASSWTRKAIGELEKKGPGYIEYLRKLGVLPGTAPVVNDLLTSTSGLGKFTTKAMSWFKNGDEWSRSIAYLAMDLRYTEAVEKLAKGTFGSGAEAMQGFKRYAGLHLIENTNPDVVEKVLRTLGSGLLENGSIDSQAIAGSRHLFASEAVKQTLFDWSSLNTPAFYSKSLLGKLFGRYGSYSAGYRANIIYGLSNGTRADKLAFLTKFVGNNLAVKGVLVGLGIASADFTPFAPALFGGGPDFDLATSLLKAPSTSFKGKQARADLLRMVSPVIPVMKNGQLVAAKANFPSLLPGSMQARYLTKMMDSLERGDYYSALLAATMTSEERVLE
jgi:hypothetical protein